MPERRYGDCCRIRAKDMPFGIGVCNLSDPSLKPPNLLGEMSKPEQFSWKSATDQELIGGR
jgi:hypothetical protein